MIMNDINPEVLVDKRLDRILVSLDSNPAIQRDVREQVKKLLVEARIDELDIVLPKTLGYKFGREISSPVSQRIAQLKDQNV